MARANERGRRQKEVRSTKDLTRLREAVSKAVGWINGMLNGDPDARKLCGGHPGPRLSTGALVKGIEQAVGKGVIGEGVSFGDVIDALTGTGWLRGVDGETWEITRGGPFNPDSKPEGTSGEPPSEPTEPDEPDEPPKPPAPAISRAVAEALFLVMNPKGKPVAEGASVVWLDTAGRPRARLADPKLAPRLPTLDAHRLLRWLVVQGVRVVDTPEIVSVEGGYQGLAEATRVRRDDAPALLAAFATLEIEVAGTWHRLLASPARLDHSGRGKAARLSIILGLPLLPYFVPTIDKSKRAGQRARWLVPLIPLPQKFHGGPRTHAAQAALQLATMIYVVVNRKEVLRAAKSVVETGQQIIPEDDLVALCQSVGLPTMWPAFTDWGDIADLLNGQHALSRRQRRRHARRS